MFDHDRMNTAPSVPCMPFMIATGDPNAWLAAVPSNAVDALVIDPGALTRRSAASTDLPQPERTGTATPSELALRQGPLAFQAYRVLRPGRRALWVCRAGEWAAIAALAARLRFDVGCPILWERSSRRHHVVLVLGKAPGARTGPLSASQFGTEKRSALCASEFDCVATDGDDAFLPDAIARLFVDATTLPGDWIWDPFGSLPTLGTAAIGAGRGYACNVRDARRARVLAAAFEALGAARTIVPPYGIGGARGLGQLTIFGDAMGGDATRGFGDGLSDGTGFRESAASAD